MIKKLVFWYCSFLVFYSLPSSALDFREEIKGKVVQIAPSQTRFIIDRGSEDGVLIGDMARIFINDRICGSVVAIDAKSRLSEWVFQQVYSINSFTKDAEVKLVSLFGEKRPSIYNLQAYQENSMLKHLVMEEKERQKNHDKHDKIVSESSKKGESASKIKTYETHFPDMKFKFFLAPLTVRSKSRGQQMHYGFSVQNYEQTKEVTIVDYEYARASFKSRSPNNDYSASNMKTGGRYEKKNQWGENRDHLSFVQFKKEREGGIHFIRSQVRLAPIGVQWRKGVGSWAGMDEISFAYAPLKEFYSTDNVRQTGNNGRYAVAKEAPWRHYLELRIKSEFKNRFTISNTLSYAPAHELITGPFSAKDADLLEVAEVNFEVFPQFSLNYKGLYSWDTRRKKYNDSASSEWTQILSFFYETDFL